MAGFRGDRLSELEQEGVGQTPKICFLMIMRIHGWILREQVRGIGEGGLRRILPGCERAEGKKP